MLMPVSPSPCKIADCIGDAPLYFGRRDAWTFINLFLSRRRFGIICPKDATTHMSHSSIILSILKSVLTLSVWYVSSESSFAVFITSGIVRIIFLPTGLSMALMTFTTEK